MILRATDEILDATEHLPRGAALVVPQVAWDEYERLLENLAGRVHLRVSYDCGRLQIVSQLSEHGEYERLIEDLVAAACQLFRLKLEKRGSATWMKQSVSRGVEADASYYIENATRIIGKRKIDLECDPPPDIVVEIDVTNDSLDKFSICAALGIPEIWRYDGQAFRFYKLDRGSYTEARVSRFLPVVTGPMLADALELSKTRGQDAARSAFLRNLRKQMRTK
jgi:Uma2 family endonuclease